MKLIIDIPEEIYIHLLERYKYQNTDDIGLSELDKAGVSIKNATPLPKEHGDLIDRDELKSKIMYAEDKAYETWDELYDCVLEDIENAPTIIEAEGSDSK